jgi:Ni,Fe-hydrogenase I cytochrome b subunit
MVNLAHKLFININLKPASEAKSEAKFTYFIGKGNNRLLIKSLMNRRFWWEETKDQFKANFVWTQLKVNELYQHEPITQYP